jgi:phosphopantothenate-cysteine ligase
VPSITSRAGHKRTISDTEKDRPLDPDTLPEGEPEVEIESLIIPALEEVHTRHIREARGRAEGNGVA